MRIYTACRAHISLLEVVSKKSFEKLDRTPPTVFHYYYQLQLKDLHKMSTGDEILEFANRNNAFKRHIRKEWDSLSISRKRVYHCLYFHFARINYGKMSYEELAKRLEIPIPVSSEYLLFRNSFKAKFDALWEESQKRNRSLEGKSLQLRSRSFGKFKVTRIYKKDAELEDYNDYNRRFRNMCKECRLMWKEQVTEEQKIEITKKLKDARNNFLNRMDNEIKALDALQENMSKILNNHTTSHIGYLKVERPLTNTIREPLNILLVGKKRK
ncbi:LAFE_0F06216g1_1 [Lachancea fermentati]|uniref:LAFE_0F06216g1_1 n=1 Tax=Lachancea fermentati TaxID=4955 RepID=A0A1G4MF03_LACFM|nr:LAFE_0F06216g1_1 [Lachancea fermentati]